MYWSSNVRITGERFNKNSKGFRILRFIEKQNGASKYDCLTTVLRKTKSRQKLRGYYSVYFGLMVKANLLTLDSKTHIYSVTEKGKELILSVKNKG
jgi:hypothetical protein